MTNIDEKLLQSVSLKHGVPTDVLREVVKAMPETYWWLSFADDSRPEGQRSLGVAVIRADSLIEAMMKARELGIHPGGDVKGTPFSNDTTRIPPHHLLFMTDTLRSQAEMVAAGILPA